MSPSPGESSGTVEVKTRLPIHLHAVLVNLAARNDRSMAAELRQAILAHVSGIPLCRVGCSYRDEAQP